MKSIFTITFVFICSFQILLSQDKFDYIWPLGFGPEYHSPTTGIVQGGILMDFNNTPPTLSLHSFISEEQKSSICDSTGQLLAYTDGCNIYNREHTTILNGDSLNPGKVFEEFCSTFPDYPLWQGCLFLPQSGSNDHFYLLHLRKDDWLWNPMDLMYSIVDATGDNGKGEVIAKNQIVFSDSIWLGNYISATRHANGRDWWIVVPQRFSPGFHVSILTPEGVGYKGLQIFGDSTYQVYGGQTTFSPDGSKYFRNWPEGLLMLDFDRCTGLFSNPVYLDYTVVPNGAGGVAVSPSNQYLYLTAGDTVHQYDLWAADLVASRQTVAEYDGYVSPFPTYFFQAMLAPNGKIYFTAGSSNNVLHVIHDPDSLGLACNVEQHGVTLPALTGYIMPNYANYRLYDLPGSPCDTLGIDSPVAVKEPETSEITMGIAPNPANDLLTVQLKAGVTGIVEVRDLTGKILLTTVKRTDDEVIELNTPHLLSGIYFVSFRSESGLLNTRKMVVQR
ncbi:MAG: T9SS C-terminal target domain-containing protein [Haliscomenobacteraceae bacterium CHB4]|nr:hypothetical protein [Saprospiraceae bacterium]MCE7926820.1 T9SS C-terminal target domain-containing protein [Haliscomenobacteraceae bacterium CHB4]